MCRMNRVIKNRVHIGVFKYRHNQDFKTISHTRGASIHVVCVVSAVKESKQNPVFSQLSTDSATQHYDQTTMIRRQWEGVQLAQTENGGEGEGGGEGGGGKLYISLL